MVPRPAQAMTTAALAAAGQVVEAEEAEEAEADQVAAAVAQEVAEAVVVVRATAGCRRVKAVARHPDKFMLPVEIMNRLLEMDAEIDHYLGGLNTGDADEEIKFNSYLEQHDPAWFLVIRRPDGFFVDAHTVDKQTRFHSGPFDYGQLHRLKAKWPVDWHGAP